MAGPDDLIFCGPAVPHVPLLERLAPARAAGFVGVSVIPTDIWALEAAGMSARDIARRIADEGLIVCNENTDHVGSSVRSPIVALSTAGEN